MACFRRILFPIRVPIFSSISPSNPSLPLIRNPISGRFHLLKIRPKNLEHILSNHGPRFNKMFSMQRKVVQNLNLSGRKLFNGSFLGLSAVAGMMYHQSNIAYAGDEHDDFREPSGILKEDLDSLRSLLKKFQLPAVLLITVFLGWRHPITLAINIALLLFCTRPNPSSIYIFIEQLRRREMHQDPRLYKSKLFYAKKVEVKDFKLLCFAKLELRDMKLDIVGILGNWWVLQTSRT